jgi:hypothetical protein
MPARNQIAKMKIIETGFRFSTGMLMPSIERLCPQQDINFLGAS